MSDGGPLDYDFFLCHASEDKAGFVDNLASALRGGGAKLWYDDFVLTVGDSLRVEIDRGLAASRCGIVVLSPNFFDKRWPQRELDGLTALGSRILPIWHNVDRDEVVAQSPPLADIVALQSTMGVAAVTERLMAALTDQPICQGSQSTTAAIAASRHVEPGAGFRSRPLANADAYATVSLARLPEVAAPFTDDERQVIEDAMRAMEPGAECWRDVPTFVGWRLQPAGHSRLTWAAEFHPGPAIHLVRVMHLAPLANNQGQEVVLDELLAWWKQALRVGSLVLSKLGATVAAIGFHMHPYPPDGRPVLSVQFGDCPSPHRAAIPHQVAPWDFETFPVPLGDLGAVIPLAARNFLEQFSYRSLDPCVAWVRGRVLEEDATGVDGERS